MLGVCRTFDVFSIERPDVWGRGLAISTGWTASEPLRVYSHVHLTCARVCMWVCLDWGAAFIYQCYGAIVLCWVQKVSCSEGTMSVGYITIRWCWPCMYTFSLKGESYALWQSKVDTQSMFRKPQKAQFLLVCLYRIYFDPWAWGHKSPTTCLGTCLCWLKHSCVLWVGRWSGRFCYTSLFWEI